MDLEWKTPLETYGELKGYRVRYGRINANQLTDILITDPNVHHQVRIITLSLADSFLTRVLIGSGDLRTGEGD